MSTFDPIAEAPLIAPQPADYGFCRLCYAPIPPGGSRRIGICTACAFAPARDAAPPTPQYAFGRRHAQTTDE